MNNEQDKKQKILANQRNQRFASNYKYTKKYEKTLNGFLMRTYRNMRSRIKGLTNKSHLYVGKEILEKEDFYEWSKTNKDFKELFLSWENSKYNRRLTPSVDRINSNLGYTLDNIEWVPFHVNCSRGGKSGH